MSGSMKKLIYALAMLISIPALAGCDSPAASTGLTLEDTNWVMEAYGEVGNLKNALPGVEVALYFDSAEMGAGGNGGINHYGGKYQLDGNQLTFPEGVITTCLGGHAAVLQQEEEYIRLLSSADSFEISNGKLHLICDSQEIIFHVSAAPPSSTAIGWP
jgi:heat shock protein HslJ